MRRLLPCWFVLFALTLHGPARTFGAPPIGVNLLSNAGFESGSASGWSVYGSTYAHSNSNPSPAEGSWYFDPGGSEWTIANQEFDLEQMGYDPHRLATGGYYVSYGGLQRSRAEIFPQPWPLPPKDKSDEGRISLKQRKDGANWTTDHLGWHKVSDRWLSSDKEVLLLSPGTRYVKYQFDAARYPTVTYGPNDAHLDAAYLKIQECKVWTFGDNNVDYAGPGPWNSEEVSVGYFGPGEVFVSSGGQWTSGGPSWTVIGADSNAPGKVTISDGTWLANSYVSVGSKADSQVTLNGGQWTTATSVNVGNDNGVTGTVAINNGAWTANGQVRLGFSGSGQLELNGGTWKTKRETYLGWSSLGSGNVVINDGQWSASDDVEVGHSGSGSVQLNGGSASFSNLTVRNKGKVTLDGGVMHVGRGTFYPAAEFQFLGGELHIANNVGGLNATVGENCLMDVSGSWQTDDATILPGASVTLDGGRLLVRDGGQATVLTPIQFTENGGEFYLGKDSRLIHGAGTMELQGNQIEGSGELLVGSAGVNLGTVDKPGRLVGWDETTPLLVYGNVTGSGSLTNTTVFGEIEVGNSPGEMTLSGVTLGNNSSIVMEIAGTLPDEYDRLLLGDDVDFADAPIRISFADGFLPELSDTFGLFDPLDDDGAVLAALEGAVLSVPEGWVVDRTTGLMAQVPEPGTIALLGIAICVLLVWGCRTQGVQLRGKTEYPG